MKNNKSSRYLTIGLGVTLGMIFGAGVGVLVLPSVAFGGILGGIFGLLFGRISAERLRQDEARAGRPRQGILELAAGACKFVAIFVLLVSAPIMMSAWHDEPDPATSGIVIESLFIIFASLPNHLLVGSRAVFIPSLVIALLPLCCFLHGMYSDYMFSIHSPEHSGYFRETLGIAVLSILMSATLPVSIILSRIRQRRGDKVTYA
jgi:hypothetical protein